jgi:hypothetical protein
MLLQLYEKTFSCSVQQNAPQSSKSCSIPAETVTKLEEVKSEAEDNEENKDSYTLSQKIRPDSEEEEEAKVGIQYEECNQVFVLQHCWQ